MRSGSPLTRSTNKETPTRAPHTCRNKLMYILLRRALSANTKNSRVVVLTGSSPSEHVAMLAHCPPGAMRLLTTGSWHGLP